MDLDTPEVDLGHRKWTGFTGSGPGFTGNGPGSPEVDLGTPEVDRVHLSLSLVVIINIWRCDKVLLMMAL